MEGAKGFAEIWTEAHRERSEYVWSLFSGLIAAFRRHAAPQPAPDPVYQPAHGTLANG
jgi:hypothetical protein